jgi:hypothetical protein
VKHWAQGGETKLTNLVTLCRFHHRQVHEGQVVVKILGDGAFRFVRPDGRSFESPVPQSTGWAALVAAHEMHGVRVTPRTAITAWTGEALDYSQAIEWLSRNKVRPRARESSAP